MLTKFEAFKKRLESMRYRVCGPYCGGSPRPTAGNGAMFYLDSDFAPGLRWKYCDLVDGVGRRIQHKGWYCDEYCDQTIRGIVMRLPKGRGFLSGWTMGEGMASWVFTQHSFETEIDAALDADDEARIAAKREREYQAKMDAEREEAEVVRE